MAVTREVYWATVRYDHGAGENVFLAASYEERELKICEFVATWADEVPGVQELLDASRYAEAIACYFQHKFENDVEEELERGVEPVEFAE